ncbi:caspase family protein [Nocardia sp. NPDC006044]|uniref:caspase, EACC1-associated type n=1 Tax=Nocardia sp. NPDC006044 TaxID=3364306 RepID=UPI003687C655
MRLNTSGSRVLIVGTGTHVAGSLLPDVPAVAATVAEVRAALTEQCGLAETSVTGPLLDPTQSDFGDALSDVAGEAEGVLVVYYVGHGIVGPDDELYLATRETDHYSERLHRALRYTAVEQVLAGSRARTIVVILDCCFAGRALGPIGNLAVAALDVAKQGGTYVLAAASRSEHALARPGATYTEFSGALIEFLRAGDATEPAELTLEGAYRFLHRVLSARQVPGPRHHVTGQAGALILASNPAFARTQPPIEPDGFDDADPVAELPCPYRGLHAFTVDDAALFFGRDDAVRNLLAGLRTALIAGDPVAVVGPTGAGKSSLLQAGLLPAVAHGHLGVPGAQQWPHVVMTPGPHPMRGLSALRQTTLSTRMLLVVDQLEEVFTLCRAESERRRFLTVLCALARESDCFAVVLGIRADFYGHCLHYPELASVLVSSAS